MACACEDECGRDEGHKNTVHGEVSLAVGVVLNLYQWQVNAILVNADMQYAIYGCNANLDVARLFVFNMFKANPDRGFDH